MGAMKRWRNLGGGEFYRFTEVGQCLEGIWRGTEPATGRYPGENGVVELPDGSIVKFRLSTTLKDLTRVPIGTDVRITYRGMGRSKAGNQFHAFTVQVDDAAKVEEDDDHDKEVPF